MKLSKGYLALIIIIAVIILDQTLKIWVKTSFSIGESVHITDWFQLCFVENNGMAFGLEIGNKLFLTLFRIILVIGVIYYICRIKSRTYIKKGYIAHFALIAAGALGNIIDCMFYGLIFDDPVHGVATFMPEEGGYAPLFYGKVVDMLYFPLFSFEWPDWVPFVGGEHFLFFQPIFNIADAAITIGLLSLIIFYQKSLSITHKPERSEEIE